MDENRLSSQAPSQTDADRIALAKMFKAIAEYGRRARLRRLAACDQAESTQENGTEDDHVVRLEVGSDRGSFPNKELFER